MKVILNSFEDRFVSLHKRSCALIAQIPDENLFWKPHDLGRTYTMFSCGEYILRSAAMVEKTFGGITTRLWDDPFEWTLREELSCSSRVTEYLIEVEKTRIDGFAFFTSDEDLTRHIPAPETLRPIFDILMDALAKAEHFQGRAFAVFQMFSDEKLPRL